MTHREQEVEGGRGRGESRGDVDSTLMELLLLGCCYMELHGLTHRVVKAQTQTVTHTVDERTFSLFQVTILCLLRIC